VTDLTPTHRRTITIESFDVDEGFDITGRLVDERPWADGVEVVRTVHSMSLTLRVDRASMVITDANAEMASYPHVECRSIEPAFRALVGLSITRGYTRAVQARLGREQGCSHLEFLARAMGPAAIQTMASSRGRTGGSPVSDEGGAAPGGWLTNTCHLWADGGIGFEKVRNGWRPGADRYPTPSLVELRTIRVTARDEDVAN
jgi:hypothetical protein